MSNTKVIIRRRPSYRYIGLNEAAKELGVSGSAVRQFIRGRVETISKAKRDRIVIKTLQPKKGI